MKKTITYAILISIMYAVVQKWGIASVGTPLVCAFCIWYGIVFWDKEKRTKAE